jgi:hypothetical protein
MSVLQRFGHSVDNNNLFVSTHNNFMFPRLTQDTNKEIASIWYGISKANIDALSNSELVLSQYVVLHVNILNYFENFQLLTLKLQNTTFPVTIYNIF